MADSTQRPARPVLPGVSLPKLQDFGNSHGVLILITQPERRFENFVHQYQQKQMSSRGQLAARGDINDVWMKLIKQYDLDWIEPNFETWSGGEFDELAVQGYKQCILDIARSYVSFSRHISLLK